MLGTSPGAVFTAITGNDGAAALSDVDEGTYRIIVQVRGYRTFRTAVDVISAKRTSVRVELLPELTSIGRVTATSSVRHDSILLEPIRKVSPTLADALNHFADVSASAGNVGLGLSASLRNGDPSATNYSVNGVPLAGSGAGLSINTDLLASASVNQDSDTVDFTYLAPTLAPRFVATAAQGGFGESVVKSSFQATPGAAGIAIVHAVRGANSVLNGQTYLDASGLSYRHVGAVVSAGNYAKAALPVGNWSASLLVADSRAVSNPIPTYYDGDLPAGDGPGTVTTTHSLNTVATANGLLGTTAVSVGLSSIGVTTHENRSTRYINLIRAPADSGGTVSGSDITIAAQRSVSARTSIRTTLTRTNTAVDGWSTTDRVRYAGGTTCTVSHRSSCARTHT